MIFERRKSQKATSPTCGRRGARRSMFGVTDSRQTRRRGWPGALAFVLLGVLLGVAMLSGGGGELAANRPLRDVPGEVVAGVVGGAVVSIWRLGGAYTRGRP